jgi:hypothetical protein
MSKPKILSLIILLLSAFTIYSQNNSNNDSINYSWTILPSNTPWTEVMLGKDYKTFTPSKEDIIEAEKILNTCFSKEKEDGNFKSNKFLKNYTRQYLGATDKNGHKIIWINCFCGKPDPKDTQWKTTPFIVDDGGDCFFNIKIDLSDKKYFDLQINGEA